MKNNIIKHNGVPCVEATVHMLPTGKHKLYDGIEETADVQKADSMIVSKEMYITSDEKIKNGDWVYWTDPEGLTSDINQVISVDEEMIFLSHPEHSETEALPHECRKIIATTDPKLVKLIAGGGEGNAGVWKMLPQIQQSFIEEYCKAGGIDKVLVEYEEMCIDDNCDGSGKCGPCLITKQVLKTDSNNCIIIHPVEEEMYSREELIQELSDYLLEYRDYPWKEGLTLKQWIKENL